MGRLRNKITTLATSALACAVGVGLSLVGGAAPAVAAGGQWELTAANPWEWGAYPAHIVDPLEFNEGSWRISGGYTGGQLTSVTVTEACGTRVYSWTLPPATASEGQTLATTLTAGGTCGPKYWFWDTGFDLANIEPGMTSAWNYTGRMFVPNGDTGGTQAGSVVFPLADDTAADAAGAKKVRLQVKGERWAIQYVYTWVPAVDDDINVDEGNDEVPVVVPGAPTAVKVKPVSSRKAKVTWSPPVTGSPVTKYTIKARGARPGKKWSKWQTGSTSRTSITVNLKKAGSKMQVYVIASNTAGAGPASSVVTKKMPKA